ncbi:lysosomal alpha-mannosidase-like [Amblyomma americanum]
MRFGRLVFTVIAFCLAAATAQPMMAAGSRTAFRSEPPGGLGVKPKPPGTEIHCTFKLCQKPKPDVINIHFVPHSHMDIASHNTFESNFLKATSILNSVSGELLKNKKRMFSVTEMAFLKRWYESSNEVFKIIFKKFVSEGRVELVSGGMVMNDEASTHYSDIVDQMTLGMRWINATFGACALPRAVWQLDTYGHSREQAALFAQMGFDGLFLGRVSHLERRWRGNQDALEFVWHADQKLQWEIFTSILPHRYSPPGVVNFREFFLTDENKANVAQAFIDAIETAPQPVDSPNEEFQDDPSTKGTRTRANAGDDSCTPGSTDCVPVYPAAAARRRYRESPRGALARESLRGALARESPDPPPVQTGRGYQTLQRIVMFGEDFAYTNATVWYSQMDTLIDTINAANGSRFYAFYSTPECYLRAVHEQWFRRKRGSRSEEALSYSGDFLPYSDRNFEWWTGFYSSRPQLKYHIRQASNFLQVCRQVTALLNTMHEPTIQKLEMAIAMAQHHDAITGTSTSEVATQFIDRISKALDDCEEIVGKAIDTLTTMGSSQELFPKFCRKLNQSECAPSETLERVSTHWNCLHRNELTCCRIERLRMERTTLHPLFPGSRRRRVA